MMNDKDIRKNTANVQTPAGTNKILTVESDIFFALRKTYKWQVVISVSCVLIAIIMLIASILVVSVGKGKDKIIERDATGKPRLLQVDSPDHIYGPELEVFIKESARGILSWNYMEVRDQVEMDRRIQRINILFTGDGFREFFQPFRDIYLKSIGDQKLVVTAEVEDLKDLKIKGPDAFIRVSIKRSSIRVIGEGASEEQKEVKFFEIRVHKGVRTLANPYGLYISRFSELVSSK